MFHHPCQLVRAPQEQQRPGATRWVTTGARDDGRASAARPK